MKSPDLSCWPLLLSLVLVLGCDGGGTGPGKDQVASVTVTPPSPTVDVGSTVQLSTQIQNEDGDLLGTAVTWATSDGTVASTTNGGLVTGVAEGTATITATAGGVSGSASVTVVDPTLPDQPSDIAATPLSNTQIQVSWTDNADNEDEFRIDREVVTTAVAEGVGGPAQAYAQVGLVGADVTSFVDQGLASATAYRYQVRACNQNGCADPVSPPAPVTTFQVLSIETASLPAGFLGAAYSVEMEASGGDGDPAWSLSEGTLPAGIGLSVAGLLSGTPTEPGTFPIIVQAVGGGQAVTQALTLNVLDHPTVTTTSVPGGAVGLPYSFGFQAAGGDGTYRWSVSDGGLPDGLDLSVTGLLHGTPTSAGLSFFTVEVASGGEVASADFGMRIYNPLIITTSDLSAGVIGEAYAQDLVAIGGDGTYAWTLKAGTPPDGVTLDPVSGTLSGTPTAAGAFSFTVEVASADLTTSKALSVTVFQSLSIVTESLSDGEVGTPYQASLVAIGGDGIYEWSISSGTLPGGLSLAADGTISGTPGGASTWNFTARVESGDGQIRTRSFSLRVEQQPLAVYCDGPTSGGECTFSPVLVPDFTDVVCGDASDSDVCPSQGQARFGQDGNYSINPETFTLHSSGDQRLVESVSGLTWTTEAFLADSFQDATQACGTLASGMFGGVTDWRVPSLRELAMILSKGASVGVWPEGMDNPQNSVWWTTTRHESLPSLKKGVSGNWPWTYGIPIAGGAGSFQGARYTFCVSGPEMAGAWEVNADGVTVTHTTTGLVWHRFESTSTTMTWDEALEYCESSARGGFTDWRLPTLRESVSAFDLEGMFGFMSDAFGQEPTAKMLTSTPVDVGGGATSIAWIQESSGTLSQGDAPTLVGAARCVRGPG